VDSYRRQAESCDIDVGACALVPPTVKGIRPFAYHLHARSAYPRRKTRFAIGIDVRAADPRIFLVLSLLSFSFRREARKPATRSAALTENSYGILGFGAKKEREREREEGKEKRGKNASAPRRNGSLIDFITERAIEALS